MSPSSLLWHSNCQMLSNIHIHIWVSHQHFGLPKLFALCATSIQTQGSQAVTTLLALSHKPLGQTPPHTPFNPFRRPRFWILDESVNRYLLAQLSSQTQYVHPPNVDPLWILDESWRIKWPLNSPLITNHRLISTSHPSHPCPGRSHDLRSRRHLVDAESCATPWERCWENSISGDDKIQIGSNRCMSMCDYEWLIACKCIYDIQYWAVQYVCVSLILRGSIPTAFCKGNIMHFSKDPYGAFSEASLGSGSLATPSLHWRRWMER